MQTTRGDPLLAEVLEYLGTHNTQVLRDFLAAHDLPVTGLQQDVLDRVADAVTDGYQHGQNLRHIDFEKLVTLLDELRLHDAQHVVLFRLAPGDEEHLDLLRTPAFWRERLDALGYTGDRDCLGHERHVRDAPDAPELSLVRIDDDRVLCKWIETRDWKANVGTKDGPVLEPRRQLHSVNFLLVHLDDGRAELRIEPLKTYASRSLQDELGIFRNAADRLIGLSHFVAVSLEPAVRALLRGFRGVETQSWEVAPPPTAGGKKTTLSGHGDPRFLQRLMFRWKGMRGLRISVVWDRVSTRLESRSDQIFIGRADAAARVAVLEHIRDLAGGERFRIAELNDFAAKHPEWRATARTLDHQLRPDDEQTLELGRVVADWKPEKGVPTPIAVLLGAYPTLFRLNWYVRCPTTKTTASDGKVVHEYAEAARVPANVRCNHGTGRVGTHKTQSYLRARLYYTPAREKGWPGLLLLIAWIFRLGPSETAMRKRLTQVGVLLFAVLFIPAVLFVHTRLGAKGSFLESLPVILAYIVLAAVILVFLGRPLTTNAVWLVKRAAAQFIEELIPMVWKFIIGGVMSIVRRFRRARGKAKARRKRRRTVEAHP